jgi:hypothetical protein
MVNNNEDTLKMMRMVNNGDSLNLAKQLLDRIVADYPTMFHKDGFIKSFGYDMDMRTCPTRVKDELRLIRRLLLEVEKRL